MFEADKRDHKKLIWLKVV